MTTFDCAAYKLLVSDLAGCRVAGDGRQLWCPAPHAQPLPLRLVWLQGVVTHVSVDGKEAELDDGTGTVRVLGCANIPGGSGWLRYGLYCMVVGEVCTVQPPKVFAIKITQLGEVHQDMWPLEVKHARRHLVDTDHVELVPDQQLTTS